MKILDFIQKTFEHPKSTTNSAIQHPSIVLTGGPCGGKTTLMRELRAKYPDAQYWLFVPESALLLFSSGLTGSEKSFQRAVVHLQIALEDTIAHAASANQVLLCHRGTLDALAYWLRNGWDEDEFFAYVGLSREHLFRRYYSVIHLQTAAIGAVNYYKRWPDAHRPETIEQAAETDWLCAHVWKQHPHYNLVNNEECDWTTKSRLAQKLLETHSIT
jgi:hypothetical protein